MDALVRSRSLAKYNPRRSLTLGFPVDVAANLNADGHDAHKDETLSAVAARVANPDDDRRAVSS